MEATEKGLRDPSMALRSRRLASEGEAVGFDAEAYLNEPRWDRSSLGLERITRLLDELDRPQQAMAIVHVAGTNGKGSVCAYLSSMLQAAGYRTGLFTSPAVLGFADRVQVDGQPIGSDDLREATLRVREAAEAVEGALGEHPTEFELMAAVGFEQFRAQGCDIAVVEVGLGGRLDATNVVEPEACVIARIGLDHTSILGGTLAAIAGEKAGIVKPGAPVVSWPQAPAAMAVIEEACATAGCALRVPDLGQLEVGPISWEDARALRPFSYQGQSFATGMLGAYQPANAALAIEAAQLLASRGWGLGPAAIAQGIRDARWPGRFEVLGMQGGNAAALVLDGGHNPQGAQALVESLEDALGGMKLAGRVAFVMGAMADKDYHAMLRAIAPLAGRLIAYAPDSPRALEAAQLAAAAVEELPSGVAVEAAPGPEEAIARACSGAGAGDVVVAFGSLYGIAACREAAESLGYAVG